MQALRLYLFLAMLGACRHSWARDQIKPSRANTKSLIARPPGKVLDGFDVIFAIVVIWKNSFHLVCNTCGSAFRYLVCIWIWGSFRTPPLLGLGSSIDWKPPCWEIYFFPLGVGEGLATGGWRQSSVWVTECVCTSSHPWVLGLG